MLLKRLHQPVSQSMVTAHFSDSPPCTKSYFPNRSQQKQTCSRRPSYFYRTRCFSSVSSVLSSFHIHCRKTGTGFDKLQRSFIEAMPEYRWKLKSTATMSMACLLAFLKPFMRSVMWHMMHLLCHAVCLLVVLTIPEYAAVCPHVVLTILTHAAGLCLTSHSQAMPQPGPLRSREPPSHPSPTPNIPAPQPRVPCLHPLTQRHHQLSRSHPNTQPMGRPSRNPTHKTEGSQA